jgi:hypothetical protein
MSNLDIALRERLHVTAHLMLQFLAGENFEPVDRREAWVTSDIIVARDDHGGLGSSPFQDLKDDSDHVAGRLVSIYCWTQPTRTFLLQSTPSFLAPRFWIIPPPATSVFLQDLEPDLLIDFSCRFGWIP